MGLINFSKSARLKICLSQLFGCWPWRRAPALADRRTAIPASFPGAVLLHVAEARLNLGRGWLWPAAGAPLITLCALLSVKLLR